MTKIPDVDDLSEDDVAELEAMGVTREMIRKAAEWSEDLMEQMHVAKDEMTCPACGTTGPVQRDGRSFSFACENCKWEMAGISPLRAMT